MGKKNQKSQKPGIKTFEMLRKDRELEPLVQAPCLFRWRWRESNPRPQYAFVRTHSQT
jgi:hypothetical protein